MLDPTVAAVPAPRRPVTPVALYDSRRDIEYVRPSWRGWLHLAWFLVSLVIGTLLLVSARGAVETAGAAIYAGSVTGLFGVSALYHLGNWRPSVRTVLQRLDHLMIFFLIAGTATPVFLLTSPGTFGRVCLVSMWLVTLVLAAVHLVWMHAPERLVGAVFIALGLLTGLSLPHAWTVGGAAVGTLIGAGGLFYIVGAVLYHRRRPDPSPAHFGYHEVFHAFVCVAAACHYVAVALLI